MRNGAKGLEIDLSQAPRDPQTVKPPSFSSEFPFAFVRTAMRQPAEAARHSISQKSGPCRGGLQSLAGIVTKAEQNTRSCPQIVKM